MCGIVGISSKRDCIQNIISGLNALDYRGYDSSGIAIADNNIMSGPSIVRSHLMIGRYPSLEDLFMRMEEEELELALVSVFIIINPGRIKRV